MGGVAFLKHPVGMEFHRFFGENLLRSDLGISTCAARLLARPHRPSRRVRAQRRAHLRRRLDLLRARRLHHLQPDRRPRRHRAGRHRPRRRQLPQIHLPLAHRHRRAPRLLEAHAQRLRHDRPRPPQALQPGVHPGPHRQEPALPPASPTRIPPTPSSPTPPTTASATTSIRSSPNSPKSVPRVHFDEAWYAYAKFHQIYRGRFAMGVPDDMPDRPTIFSVQSTHKMLAAFSMGSMIHVKLSPTALRSTSTSSTSPS